MPTQACAPVLEPELSSSGAVVSLLVASSSPVESIGIPVLSPVEPWAEPDVVGVSTLVSSAVLGLLSPVLVAAVPPVSAPSAPPPSSLQAAAKTDTIKKTPNRPVFMSAIFVVAPATNNCRQSPPEKLPWPARAIPADAATTSERTTHSNWKPHHG